MSGKILAEIIDGSRVVITAAPGSLFPENCGNLFNANQFEQTSNFGQIPVLQDSFDQ